MASGDKKRTRKELKAEISQLRVDLAEARMKFSAVNDRCGKVVRAINEARDVLNGWNR